MIDALITTIIGGLKNTASETDEVVIAGILGGIGAVCLIVGTIALMAI